MVRAYSDLAKNIPLILINSNSFNLLESGPKARRHYIDWGVFHVEQNYAKQYHQYNACLKQRNILLKYQDGSIDHQRQLNFWTQKLADKGEWIHRQRNKYLEELTQQLNRLLAKFSDNNLNLIDIKARYYRGWAAEKTLLEELYASFSKDKKDGITSKGPHRADFALITSEGHLILDYFSRGQQKLLIYILKLTQGIIFSQAKEYTCIYLIDDMVAEFDEHTQIKIVSQLQQMKAQLFITGITYGQIFKGWEDIDEEHISKFHVEQGSIS